MKTKDKIKLITSLFSIVVFRKNIPLIVSWALTQTCNLKCHYCGFWKNRVVEINTESVMSLLYALKRMGTQRIQFTGGEPLLRDDIGQILMNCKRLGISTNINSNGILVPSKIEELKNVDSLTLSLDGPKEIHDSIRGEGVFDQVIEAATEAKKNKIKFRFLTVLTNKNLGAIDFMINQALEFETSVIFQPATVHLLNSSDPNSLASSPQEYKKAIKRLIVLKRKTRSIGNSMPALRHLYHWPDGQKLQCIGGRMFCRIDTNGALKICPRYMNGVVVSHENIREAFLQLSKSGCDHCWCASNVEMSRILSLDLRAILNALKFV